MLFTFQIWCSPAQRAIGWKACAKVCLLEYQSNTKGFQCSADILHLNISLDKLEMREFVRSSVHLDIFIIAMTHEQYHNVFLMKGCVNDIYWKSFTWSKVWLLQQNCLKNKKVRRELYAQCFDELIRQTTVSGLILIDCLTFCKILFFLLSRNFDNVKKGSYTCKIDPEKIKCSSHL